jgi:Mn-containing catalase
MILRTDLIGTELPPPSDPDPAGAAAVQELMGGRFGEMSTFMNYTFQSFNFREGVRLSVYQGSRFPKWILNASRAELQL